MSHHLARSIGDLAWSSFVTKLEYKSEWLGKTILMIGKFEPSSIDLSCLWIPYL